MFSAETLVLVSHWREKLSRVNSRLQVKTQCWRMGVTLKRPDVLAGWWSVNDTATRQRPGLDSRQVCSHQAHVSQIRVTAGNRSRRSFRTSNRFYSNRPFLASSGRFCLTSPFDVIQKQQVWNFEPNTNLHLSTEKRFLSLDQTDIILSVSSVFNIFYWWFGLLGQLQEVLKINWNQSPDQKRLCGVKRPSDDICVWFLF